MKEVKNVMQKVEDATGTVDPYYDMTIGNMREIRGSSENLFDLISNSFKFGYIQGMKAEKARQKRKEKTA